MTEYPRPVCDLLYLNFAGGGKLPFEVCLFHTESQDEKPQIVAKLQSKEAARALAKWYSENMYSASVLVR